MTNNYRSFLFSPATEKMLGKVSGVSADCVIIDLEDAILPEDKDNALMRLTAFLESYSYNKDIFIRVNSDRIDLEVGQLDRFSIMGYMLPKAEGKADVDLLAKLTDKHIIALIETPMGMVNIKELAMDTRVFALAFGAEDYTTACGMENTDELLIYPKSRLVTYARAYRKSAIDTMSLNIRDREGYIKLAENSKRLGFDGKLAIHPMQVEVINEVFSWDIEKLKYIVAEYDKCGEAVMKLDGEVYEKPHIDAMRRKIEEN